MSGLSSRRPLSAGLRSAGHRLGFLATALFGGVWGALLARVLAEMWPLGPAASNPVPCLLFTPFPSIILGLGGAFGALFWRRYTAPAGKRIHPMPGWASAALSWPLALGVFYLVQPSVVPLWGLAGLIAGLGGALWLHKQTIRPPATGAGTARSFELVWDLLVFVLALALYAGTLAPSVLPGDSGEFQFVAPMLGIPHPTGYPLYLLLGKLFSLVPLRSVAYRLNLLSAVAAAGTVWAVYRCGRVLGVRRSAAILSGSLLALSEAFWSQATLAEKYTLNTFFVALTLWLGLQWQRKRLHADSSTSAGVWLSAWAFCYGLSLTHHRTMLLLAPAYLYLLWTTDRLVLSPSALARCARLALWVLAPLSLYLLLPLFSARQPPYAYIRLDSARAFWDLVLARDYQGILFRGGWSSLPGRLAEFARLVPRQFGAVGLAAALAGWLVLYRREKHVAWTLMVGSAAQVLFALNYYVPNSSVYYLPAFVWLAVSVAPAIDAVLAALGWLAGVKKGGQVWPAERTAAQRTAAQFAVRPIGPHLALAFVLIASAWPMALLLARLPGMDRRQTYSNLAFDHTYGQMAARSVEPGALLVSDWLPATVLWYTQWVEGQMPTAQVAVVDPLEGQWAGLIDGALASGRPVYLARPVVTAGDRHFLTSAGPLVRVLDAPLTSAPFMSHPAPEPPVFGGEIRLLGGDLAAGLAGAGPRSVGSRPGVDRSRFRVGVGREVYTPPARLTDERVEGGSTLHVTIYWQALHPPAGDYGVTLRLVNADLSSAGYSWLERTSRHPVGGSYPTSRWQAGEIVGDYYRLALPSHLPSGEYQLLVSIGASQSAALQSAAPHEACLARFSIRKPLRWQNPILDAPVRKLFDKELVWVGYDAPGELVPGETVSIALQWLVCGRTAPQGADVELRPRLVLVSQDGTERALTTYAGSQEDWQPGALVVDPYLFSVPDDLAYVEVQSVLEDRPGHRLLLQVASRPPPGANFGAANLGAVVRLRSHRYRTESVKSGETVHLTLEWEALRTMDEAYKVFVHVLSANGLPIAQQDNEPVNGTYPTTRWQPGERISDPYAIRLPESIPPGEYPVEVGLYRISDLSRLSVLDRDRSAVDDKVFLAPLTVR